MSGEGGVTPRITLFFQAYSVVRGFHLSARWLRPTRDANKVLHEPHEFWFLSVHEVKHDGFRIIARKDGLRVRLYSRPGNDLTKRFPLIVEAMARLPSSCTIYGDAVACDVGGLPSFDLLRHRQQVADEVIPAGSRVAPSRWRFAGRRDAA